MGGGLMQLVAYGAQDIYLTGNPQITFFKVVYRRHTNFSMEEIAQTASGTEALGSEATYTISRNGDLVHKMYVQYNNPGTPATGAAFCGSFGHTILKEIECEIGGQKIDKHYGHWLEVWSNLTEPNSVGSTPTSSTTSGPEGGDEAVGVYGPTKYQRMAGISTNVASQAGSPDERYFVPLRFWFNRNPGLALPLIALQYHEVKIKIVYEGDAGNATTVGAVKPQLFVQYIYLDTDERRRFAQVSHEYLIEQLQFQSEGQKETFTLNFNHPVKEIIWTGVPLTIAADGTGNTHGGIAPTRDSSMNPHGTSEWQLKLNGHERTSKRHSTHFTRQQIYDYHTGYGGVVQNDSIAVYSFALKPEEHQPSGTCNFSRIDTAQLVCSGGTGAGIHIYAVNYNVLRIMSGMGGLAYSN